MTLKQPLTSAPTSSDSVVAGVPRFDRNRRFAARRGRVFQIAGRLRIFGPVGRDDDVIKAESEAPSRVMSGPAFGCPSWSSNCAAAGSHPGRRREDYKMVALFDHLLRDQE
jgi:hypothetical protein